MYIFEGTDYSISPTEDDDGNSGDEVPSQHTVKILGQSGDKQWLIDEENLRLAEDLEIKTHIYIFEGTDYSISPTEDDDEMIPGISGDEGSSQHHKVKGSVFEELLLKSRLRSLVTESELEKRRQMKEENAAKKARAQKEKQQQREEQKHKKKHCKATPSDHPPDL